MSAGDDPRSGSVETPPRPRFPAPASVSPEARAFLSAAPVYERSPDRPALDDVDGWLEWIGAMNAGLQSFLGSRVPSEDQLARAKIEVGGVPTFALRPAGLAEAERSPIVIEMHGGGLVLCGGEAAWMMSGARALRRDGPTYVPDFRNPPLHPYPAALDDCLAVYRGVLEQRSPSEVIVLGESGGANLAAATVLRGRDEGLPMPAALVLLTPQLDLTESGDTFQTNLGIDGLGLLMEQNLLYAAGHDLAHPYLSPLFGDLSGFPPTFLQSGTRDLFLSNAVRMHRRLLAAGAEAELHVFEAMPHGSFGGEAPEDLELLAEVQRFERRHLQR